MKVKMIGSDQTITANDSYASRLVQQGKAIVAPTKNEKKPATKKSISNKAEGGG